MKNLMGVVGLLFLAAVAAFPGQLSFKVTGGMAFVNGNDYNKGIDGLNSYINDTFANVDGEFGKMSNAISFQGELIFSFSPQIGLGLGAGYFGLSRNDTVKFDPLGFVETVNYSPKLSAIPIFLNFHYFLQVANSMKLDFFAGPVLIISSLKWTDSDVWALWNLKHTFEASGAAFGGQIGLGLDIQLAAKVFLTLDALYRLAAWSEVKGPWTTKGTLFFWTIDDTVDDAYLWSYQIQSDGTWYDYVSIGGEGPSGSGYRNVKKSPLQLGGFAATIGFKIGL